MAKRGRPKNHENTKPLQTKLPAGAYARLEQLAEMTDYGSNVGEVARYLLLREIDDLKRAGVFERRDQEE